MLSLPVFFLLVIHYYFNSFSFWIASSLAMTQSGATVKAKQKVSIGLRSREFVGDFTAWNLECLPCRVGIAPPTRCKYSHFSGQCSVCRYFFFGFIFLSSFGGKDRQAAHAGRDCSKLIVEIGFCQNFVNRNPAKTRKKS